MVIEMNVLIINTFFRGGGAEKVSRQLYYGFRKYDDVNCFFLAGKAGEQSEPCSHIYRSGTIPQAVNRRICRMKNGQRERDWYTVRTIVRMIREKKIDLVHFHNMHGDYIGIKDIGEISKYCKVVWTLHDMWAMTGHCAYPCQCSGGGGKSACRNCPDLNLYPMIRKDIAEYLYKLKRKAFTGKKIHFAVPSAWLMKQCEQSFLDGESKTLIHNGVSTEVFHPMNKARLRQKYGISQDKLILLFAANNTDSPCKGGDILESALAKVKRKEKYELVIVGNAGHFSFDNDYVCHYMGYIQSDDKMNELYSLSDVFIIPSRAENFPCTILESLASGTPVIASDVGGIAEQIDADTGWLFDMGNAERLAEIIDALPDNKGRLHIMNGRCRKRAEDSFSEEKMLKEYYQLYLRVMEEKL